MDTLGLYNNIYWSNGMNDRHSTKVRNVLRCLKNPGLAAGAALLALASNGAHAHNGYHMLKVKTHSDWKSFYVAYTNVEGNAATKCRTIGRVDWYSVNYVKNGTNVTVQPLTSTNCTSGSLGKKTKTVPGNDGLDNFWFTY